MSLLNWFLLGLASNAAAAATWTCNDPGGALRQTQAPVAAMPAPDESGKVAAREGRLGLATASGEVIPVQFQAGAPLCGVLLLPTGATALPASEWRASAASFAAVMQAVSNAASGQIEITEGGKPVLRYNYRAIEPGALLEKVAPANRIYARARSDYIHPLYGPGGEELTRDWPVDHPHHRGIYWAWPEVDYDGKRGDLHALQTVFARPTGRVRLQSGPVFAQIEAENQWLWEDREPIVAELALMRAYRATTQGRVVDLAFQFTALKDGVTLARRGTDKYGGLNLRLATPQAQTNLIFTGASNATPRRAWSDLSGQFAGSEAASGLTVLQCAQNPDYPGAWVQYPELAWCQPTFPATGTRFALQRGKPLVLRYRFWIHPGATPTEALAAQLWDAFNAAAAAEPAFELSETKPVNSPSKP